ncbi:trimethylamine methyltransferase family protein [Planctomycetota bacterium]
MIVGKVLSDSQIEQVQHASERILEVTGFKVMHAEALALCRRAGARVDEADGVVRMPKELLRELVAKAPSRYRVTALDGIERVFGKEEDQHTQAIVTDPWIVDYETREPRRPCLEDVRRNTVVGQRLDHVMGMSCMDFPVTDVEGPNSSWRALEEHLLHHTKHNFVMATSVGSLRRWLKIGQILARGSELKDSRLLTVAVAALTPLRITELNVELMKIACAHGFPVMPTVCPTAGMTSPFSLAGTLALGNAENLFLLALTQLFNPGNPFMYTFGPAVGHMQTGACLYYTLDKVIWKTAHVQLAKSYDLPVAAECGGSMTHHFDQQSGAEGMMFMLAAVGSGADLLPGYGSTFNAVGHSTEMMLIQDAYFQAARFLKRAIRTDPEHLGLNAIQEVGRDGQFLTDDLTLKYVRGGEFFSNDLFEGSGDSRHRPRTDEVAHERAQAMVEGFESAVPHEIQEQVRRYFHDQAAS